VHNHTAWAICTTGFNAPVEVYNTQGLRGQDMVQLREQGSAFDRKRLKLNEKPIGIFQHLVLYLRAI
jgi:hypothetical protein